MITASTLYKEPVFCTDKHISILETQLFNLAIKYGWRLEAWALFSNHYHIVVQSPENPKNLPQWINHLHASTAREINRINETPQKSIWYQYWDTYLSYQNSYLARLNYVMHNPVKHKLVSDAELYRWCSASWFSAHGDRAYVSVVKNFKIDKLSIADDYD